MAVIIKNPLKKRAYKVLKIIQKSKLPYALIRKTNKNIYLSLVSDKGLMLGQISTLTKSLEVRGKKNKQVAEILTENFYKLCEQQNIKKMAFNRNGYQYHGKVKLICDKLRELGIEI